MVASGITDPMFQYEKATESIYNYKPKHGKAHGIKRPEAMNIIAVLAGIFVLGVAFTQMF